MNRGFGIGVPAMGPGAGFGANNGRVMQSRGRPSYAPGAVQSQSMMMPGQGEDVEELLAMLEAQSRGQNRPPAAMHAQPGPMPPQAPAPAQQFPASPVQAPKDRGMFGRFLGGLGKVAGKAGEFAMFGPVGMQIRADQRRGVEKEEQKTAEEEARRQQMLGQLGLSPQERALAQLFPEQAGEIIGQRFKPAAPIKGEAINDRLVNPYTGEEIGDYRDPEAPNYKTITLQDGEYEFIPGQPESLRKLGDSPVKSSLVSINTGDGSPGSRPIIGDPPKDYQARYNEQTGSYEFEPIPGSDAAREREGAAIKAGTTIRLADEQFELMSTSIDKAIEQADFWSAGLMAQATSGIGSTPARNLRATIDTIVANIGFEKLQEMRETSPTGGALGNVTERELTFLQSVRGSLDQIQDPAQLREVLAQVKQSLSIIHEIRKMNMQSNMSNSGTRIPDGNAMGADAPPLVWNSQKGDFE